MRMIFGFFACLFSLSVVCQDSTYLPAYKVYDTRQGQFIELTDIANAMDMYDVLFFGEEHFDTATHMAQNQLFQLMHKRFNKRLALSLEMIETDCQLVLDEYLQNHITKSKFKSDSRPWSNYYAYEPMVELAKKEGLAIIAANPPRRYVNMVSRSGRHSVEKLSKHAKQYLPPLPYDTLSGAYRKKFIDLMVENGGTEEHSGQIYYGQCLWDAGMSYNIAKFIKKHKQHKVLHLNGRFHSDEKLGTIEQLQHRKKSLRIANISSFPVADFDNPDLLAHKHLADYLIITNTRIKD